MLKWWISIELSNYTQDPLVWSHCPWTLIGGDHIFILKQILIFLVKVFFSLWHKKAFREVLMIVNTLLTFHCTRIFLTDVKEVQEKTMYCVIKQKLRYFCQSVRTIPNMNNYSHGTWVWGVHCHALTTCCHKACLVSWIIYDRLHRGNINIMQATMRNTISCSWFWVSDY